jgi:4-hydroxyphenylacetate 3-monooxygenase
MRNGQRYLASLNDDRNVYLDGKKVKDVRNDPSFTGIAETVASMYDVALDPKNGMIYTAPETGGNANKVYRIPRSAAELTQKRQAVLTWADVSKGFVGRSPDHVGSFLAGFASAPDVFNKGDRAFGQNVSRFYRKLIEEDLYVTYAIIPPQFDRSTTAHGWNEDLIQVGVLKETDAGMVVRGSQMLGTGTAVSDYLFISCIKPLTPQDEQYAISFVLPVSTPGLKIFCRRPYGASQTSTFDYPLSTRFDESDALIIFDDVFIPWENVFAFRDVDQVRRQFFDTAAHVLGNHQAQSRLVAKMKFILGVARRITQVNSIENIPSVQEKLGELASLACYVEGLVIAAEATSSIDKYGVARPNPRFLYGAIGLQSELYPRAVMILRELAGGGVIQPPSSYKDLTSDETKDVLDRYLRTSKVTSKEKVKLFKLAWDIVGSEFGGRHVQYEMFYAGAPFVAKGYAYRNYGYDEALASLDRFLQSYELP